MKSMMKKGLFGLFMLLAGGYANATVLKVQTLTPADINSLTVTTDKLGSANISFDLSSLSNLTMDLASVKTKGLNLGAYTATLFNKTTSAVVDWSADIWFQAGKYTSSYTFENLTSGSYVLSLTTLANSKLTVGFSAATVPVTAPVPEPETYALMGLGLLGLLAARRKKAQSSSALVAA